MSTNTKEWWCLCGHRHETQPAFEHQHLSCCGIYSRGCDVVAQASPAAREIMLANDHARICRKPPTNGVRRG